MTRREIAKKLRQATGVTWVPHKKEKRQINKLGIQMVADSPIRFDHTNTEFGVEVVEIGIIDPICLDDCDFEYFRFEVRMRLGSDWLALGDNISVEGVYLLILGLHKEGE